MSVASWAEWRSAHPDGRVLSRDTGVTRDYGRNPYPGYDDVDDPPFLFDGEADGRLAAKERIVGIGVGQEDPVAVRLAELRDRGVLAIEQQGRAVTVWWQPGTASALDEGEVAAGRDVGATGVFDSRLDGRALTFDREGDGFTDRETASAWNIFGEATAGPLAGQRLTAVGHVDTFWFAWAAYQPDTRIEPG